MLICEITTAMILFNFYSGVRITKLKKKKKMKESLSFCSVLCTKKINISLSNTPCDVMCSDLCCHQ